MRITKKKSRKPLFIVLAIVIALLIAGGVYAYAATHRTQTAVSQPSSSTPQSVSYDPPTDEQTQAGIDQKKNTIDNTTTTPSTPTSGGTLTVTQTSSGQDGATYRLRYLIDQTINTGTCKLTLTQGTKTVTKTASIQALASSSTCQGFDIATSELGSGEWQAVLNVESNGATGSTSSKIEIQ